MQLRRERIAERMKALQELVPSANKVSGPSIQSFVLRSFLILIALIFILYTILHLTLVPHFYTFINA